MPRSTLQEDAFFARLKRAASKRTSSVDDTAKADALASMRFPAQQEVADDTARYISVRCPRRGGKSFTALSIAMERCLLNPGAGWVIIGLSRPAIKRIYWRPLAKMAEALDLDLKYNHTELIAHFPNGSSIAFVGADNMAEVEKLRGPSYHGIIIDECKSFAPKVFEALLEDVLEPALDDHQGPLILIGTPGHILAGPFYISTTDLALYFLGDKQLDPKLVDRHPEAVRANRRWKDRIEGEDPTSFMWSLHTWSRRENTKVVDKQGVPTLWTDALLKKKRHGWKDDNATWRREYLGEWVAENDLQVYRYRPHDHDWLADEDGAYVLPKGHSWRLVAGLDIGYDDPFAYVMWAYSPTHPELFEVVSVAKPNLNVSQIARLINDIEAQYGTPERRVADRGGLGKMVLAELAGQHGIYCEAAEKAEKQDHIELFNTDLDNGKIHPQPNSVLSDQLLGNMWAEKTIGTERRREDDKTPNDAADAGLYGFRFCYHRMSRQIPGAPDPKTAEWYEAAEKKSIAALEAKIIAKNKPKGLNHDWWRT